MIMIIIIIIAMHPIGAPAKLMQHNLPDSACTLLHENKVSLPYVSDMADVCFR